MDGRTLAMLLDGVAQVRRERAKETARKARTRALSVIESGL
jgi:hypothetical protein